MGLPRRCPADLRSRSKSTRASRCSTAALRQDVQLAHECTFGGCGTCRLKIVEGSVDYEEFPMALTPEEAQQGYALACQARPRSDLVISAEPAIEDVCEPQRATALVKELRWFTPEVANLQLELPDLPGFRYLPGQYMNVHLGDGTHRSFSMASLPNAGTVDFHVRRIPGGRFTDSHLARSCRAMRSTSSCRLGAFRYHAEDYRPIVMVATGTGLAPIKSILESLMDDEDCPPVIAVLGHAHRIRPVPRRGDPALGAAPVRLSICAGVVARVRRVAGPARPCPGCGAGRPAPTSSGHSIYLCGSPAMIADAKHVFLARGADLEHIYTDGFSFQHASAPAPAHAA